jgi:hypothetical protein
MLGEKIIEGQGQLTGNRVLPNDHGPGVKVEASYQIAGKILGVDATDMGTYWQVMRASGTLYGEGQGLAMGKNGEMATWRGFGIGKPTGKGMAVSYRYTQTWETASPAWARLNGLVVVGEWEIDENGKGKAAGWEWK